MRRLFFIIPALAVLYSCSPDSDFDYRALNRKASDEYLTTIRCSEDNGPFWNRFADKFIYAPAFDFPEFDGAAGYLFTVRFVDDVYRVPVPSRDYTNGKAPRPGIERIEALFAENAGKGEWSFKASSPKASLAPIWNDIEVGNVILKVDALDKDGKAIGTVGGFEFLRDFPFEGPYYGQARSYREAAQLALLHTHCQEFVRYWLDHDYPDPSYSLNGYVCKIVGSTVRNEVKLMELLPSLREDCLAIARKAADFMISAAQAPGTPLAYFPPTYYKDYHAITTRYAGQTMGMEAAGAAIDLLDLYDACGDERYYEQALGIARTYCRIQAEDGSVPIKMYIETAEPVNGVKATLFRMLDLFRRFDKQYGVTEFRDALARGDGWMRGKVADSFDLTGQFEDVDVRDLQPFQNLCNATYGGFASYLFGLEDCSRSDIAVASEMLALAEDQFVHWDLLEKSDGTREGTSPCVYEQYQYKTPIDASAVCVGGAFLAKYKVTGDKLALAKAKALADALTRAQDPRTGLVNTYFRYDANARDFYWLNCNLSSAMFLLKMSEILE